MVGGILGKKIGMTQRLADDGTVVPVTVVQAGPCVVVQRKTMSNDGYEAAQIGFVEFIKNNRVGKPMAGHFEKADVPPARFIREVPVIGEAEVSAGDRIRFRTLGPWC